MPLFSPTRILRATTSPAKPVKWSETLNLPRSAFPARPTTDQLDDYRNRCTDDLYEWQRRNRPANVRSEEGKETNNEFVLHDGPPYANGPAHVGHALNKVLKDIITRWHLASGKRVHYRPGWDCHGLPIELKALQAKRTNTEQATALKDAPKQEAQVAAAMNMTATDVRGIATELATSTIDVQRRSFKAWGVMGEWDRPYRTMDADFEIKQLNVFKEMAGKGLISRHHRPVYWSPSSLTALAEGELEYDENHKCVAAFVKMPFIRLPKIWQENAVVDLKRLSVLVWTTTPWTLPANKAIAVNPDMEYTVVTLKPPGSPESKVDQMLVAKDRIEHVTAYLPKGTVIKTVVDSVSGSKLGNGEAACWNLFQASESPILQADFVTSATGTGIVHMAPGHGMEDFLICEQNNVGPAFAPVDDEGRYTSEAFGPGRHSGLLEGLQVETEGVKAALDILRESQNFSTLSSFEGDENLTLVTHEFVHKTPIDWRTKQPVIIRATAQWFADVSAIKNRAIAALNKVTFSPEGGRTRLRSFIEGRSSWCISRQRAWGVPIPALYHKQTGEGCITQESIDHIISVIEERGTDAWFSDPPDDRVWIHPSLELDSWVRGKDTMDVWFDSGTTWTTLDDKHADVYIEGTDQHRGWFQSSLLTTVATQDNDAEPRAPFKTLITHGFTLDAEGKKMSKSLGNVISPDQIMDGSLLPPVKSRKQKGGEKNAKSNKDGTTYDAMGPDALRLWVASSDYTRDITISAPVLQSAQQALQKYRVTFKFLLGVLSDYQTSSEHDPSVGRLTFADRAVLYRLSKTSYSVHQAYREYKFYKVVNDINAFVNLDLSAFYFEIIKDAMYAGSTGVRKRTQYVLRTLLQELLRMLGPITPLLIEEVWEFMPAGLKAEVVHPLQQVWEQSYLVPGLEHTQAEGIERELEVFKVIGNAVKLAQEEARTAGKLRSGLACKVEICLAQESSPATKDILNRWQESGDLADMLVVSQAVVVAQQSTLDCPWQFEESFEAGSAEDLARGTATILSPTGHKCVRCWKFTAGAEDAPCSRCQNVLAET